MLEESIASETAQLLEVEDQDDGDDQKKGDEREENDRSSGHRV